VCSKNTLDPRYASGWGFASHAYIALESAENKELSVWFKTLLIGVRSAGYPESVKIWLKQLVGDGTIYVNFLK
tara:strand:+ start:4985 stop:5203 length:219 start_codon:yes stop_codon:yes gene_type:complete